MTGVKFMDNSSPFVCRFAYMRLPASTLNVNFSFFKCKRSSLQSLLEHVARLHNTVYKLSLS